MKHGKRTKLIDLSIDFPYVGDEVVRIPLGENEEATISEYLERVKEGNYLDELPKLNWTTQSHLKRQEEDLTECHNCEQPIYKKDGIATEWYDTPFKKEPVERVFCSNFCADGYKGQIYSKDFAYFTCCECERTICEQNPLNGWHVQWRPLDEGSGEQICLACYKKRLLESGLTDEEIASGTMHGMFFNTRDLDEAGFIEHSSHNVKNTDDAKAVSEELKKLKAEGNIVLINYDRLAIGGLEGFIEVYYRPAKEATPIEV